MARGVNKAILVGNVGQDPEIRETKNGVKVANVSLATTEKYKDQESTEWHRLTFWDALAEIVEQYVSKGDRLYVEGKIQYSTYEKDGVTKYSTEIVVRNLVMLGSPGGSRQPMQVETVEPEGEDDLPF